MRLYVLHPLLGIRVLTRSVLCPRHATPDDRRTDEPTKTYSSLRWQFLLLPNALSRELTPLFSGLFRTIADGHRDGVVSRSACGLGAEDEDSVAGQNIVSRLPAEFSLPALAGASPHDCAALRHAVQ